MESGRPQSQENDISEDKKKTTITPRSLNKEVSDALQFGPMRAEEILEFLDGSTSAGTVRDCLWDLVKEGQAQFGSDERFNILAENPNTQI